MDPNAQTITDLVTNPKPATDNKPAKKSAKAKTPSKKPAAPKERAAKSAKKAARKAPAGDVAKSPITGRKVTSTWASMTPEQRQAKYKYNRDRAAAKRAAAHKGAKPKTTAKGKRA